MNNSEVMQMPLSITHMHSVGMNARTFLVFMHVQMARDIDTRHVWYKNEQAA